jgi:hypothetical protein
MAIFFGSFYFKRKFFCAILNTLNAIRALGMQPLRFSRNAGSSQSLKDQEVTSESKLKEGMPMRKKQKA